MSYLCGRAALQMEAEQSRMTEMICDLALEIIYLLTGEKHAAVKMASIEGFLRDVYPPMSVGGNPSQTLTMKPPFHYEIPESNNQKVLEVTSKIIELLAGEVNDAGNSSPVCSFMEERGNVDKDDFLDPIMVQPPLTSQDGSRGRNPIKSHPRSFYPRDTKQENQEIPYRHQGSDVMTVKIEVKEESDVSRDEHCMEERIFPEFPTCSTEEVNSDPHHDQDENLVIMKREKEAHVRGGEQRKDEETSLQISADWCHAQFTQEQPNHILSNGGIQSDDIMLNSLDVAAPNFCSIHTQEKTLFGFGQGEPLISHEKVHNEVKSGQTTQRDTRTEENPYSCSECGKCFVKKSKLTKHRKTHTENKLYSCADCGKCFSQKSNLNEHKKTHTGEKPYSCSECGRCFSQKAVLSRHERVHTGEKPYPCSECGRSFSRKAYLTDHRRIHTGEKVHSCSECGKSFSQKSNLNTHRKTSHKEGAMLMWEMFSTPFIFNPS